MRAFALVIKALFGSVFCLVSSLCMAVGPVLPATDPASAPLNEPNSKSESSPTQAPKKWVCVAEASVENYRYSGGDWAYIHLASYGSGHEYRVTKNEAGDVAKGTTQDRTPFVCTKQ
jgi:hypothetical protein